MEISVGRVAVTIVLIGIVTWVWKVINWVWFRPKKLEKCLRQQGLNGNSYRFFFGDLKENVKMGNQARSKPMNFCHDIAPRIIPFVHQSAKKYGMTEPSVSVSLHVSRCDHYIL